MTLQKLLDLADERRGDSAVEAYNTLATALEGYIGYQSLTSCPYGNARPEHTLWHFGYNAAAADVASQPTTDLPSPAKASWVADAAIRIFARNDCTPAQAVRAAGTIFNEAHKA